jgi:hypothetical protein
MDMRAIKVFNQSINQSINQTVMLQKKEHRRTDAEEHPFRQGTSLCIRGLRQTPE